MLALAGVFDQISGIILGKHALYDDQGSGRLPIDILQEVLGIANYQLFTTTIAAIQSPCSVRHWGRMSGLMRRLER